VTRAAARELCRLQGWADHLIDKVLANASRRATRAWLAAQGKVPAIVTRREVQS
jgi:hypothetical protein